MQGHHRVRYRVPCSTVRYSRSSHYEVARIPLVLSGSVVPSGLMLGCVLVLRLIGVLGILSAIMLLMAESPEARCSVCWLRHALLSFRFVAPWFHAPRCFADAPPWWSARWFWVLLVCCLHPIRRAVRASNRCVVAFMSTTGVIRFLAPCFGWSSRRGCYKRISPCRPAVALPHCARWWGLYGVPACRPCARLAICSRQVSALPTASVFDCQRSINWIRI